MLRSLKIPPALLMLIAMLVTACATTQLTSVWKDQGYQKRPAMYMIISVDSNPVTRKFFEDEFAGQIKARGTEAIASYTVLAEDHQEDPAAIAEVVAKLGADAVLITRVASKNNAPVRAPKTLYNPVPYSPKWQDYYGHDNTSIYPPGIIAGEGVTDMETRMYEAVDVKMVWSASSETEIGGSYQQRIKGYIDVMVKTMARQGLLGR
ncbi:MAG: hypothetical protein A2V79_03010 [Betaproteobacteria bacterium RBG_16_56_24]|nr:MAG: hypothetical protein A2V79_03010 [Betaproteobacteria bacterium RBG_16_56_24]